MELNIDRETLFLILLVTIMIYIVFFKKNGESFKSVKKTVQQPQTQVQTQAQTQVRTQAQVQPQSQQSNNDFINKINSLRGDLHVLEEESKFDHLHLDSRISKLEAQQNNNLINGIKITKEWSGYPDDKLDGSEISNDTNLLKELTIVGNKSAKENKRKVGIWDQLTVHGQLCIDDVCITKNDLSKIKNNNKVALKSSSGKYCSIQPNNTIICDRGTIGNSEMILMEKL